MNIDDAVQFAQSAIENQTQQPLNDLSMAVLRGSLQGDSYNAIAKSYKFNKDYTKVVGSDLWKKLSAALGVTVNKKNLRTVIEEQLRKQHKLSAPATIVLPDTGIISDAEGLHRCNYEIPYIVGRDAAINDINTLVSQHNKIIVIQAAGGVGKSTLAKQYLNTQGFELVLSLEMAKEKENITAVESVVEEWLKQYFQEEPGREFGITLTRLQRQLQTRKVGILIDNLEPALDKQGRLIEKHSCYVEFLRVLADSTVQSVTLITSRERLSDERVNGIYHYPLSVLDVTAWEEFFTSRNIKIDADSLEAMHKVYGGNAKAMDILLGVMRTDFYGDMSGYWQENCTSVETELKNLVESQFNRLQTLDTEAYKLLCRLGCFRYQDVPRVSSDALLALLWDIPEDKRRTVIKSLRNRCLVEFQKGEYWLHPVIREEAIETLETSGQWEEVNRKAAELWTESVKTVETVEDAKKALEAYFHYIEINDYELAANVIIKERHSQCQKRSECLGRSSYRLGLLNQMISIINSIKEKILCDNSAMKIYNVLGDLYWLIGSLNKAVKWHYESGKIATKLNIGDYIVRASFNTGLCYLYLGEIETALQYFDKSYSDTNRIKDTITLPELYHSHRCACICYLAFLNSCLGFNDIAYTFVNKFYEYDSLKTDYFTIWARAYSLLYIGQTYINLGEVKKAIVIYDQAISFADKIHYTQVKAKALTGLAELCRIQNDFEKALSHHSESIELLDKIGAKCDLAEAYYQLGLTYQKMGETEKNHINFDEAIRLFNEMEAPKQVEKVETAKRGNID